MKITKRSSNQPLRTVLGGEVGHVDFHALQHEDEVAHVLRRLTANIALQLHLVRHVLD